MENSYITISMEIKWDRADGMIHRKKHFERFDLGDFLATGFSPSFKKRLNRIGGITRGNPSADFIDGYPNDIIRYIEILKSGA
jgi:hypothetical protein